MPPAGLDVSTFPLRYFLCSRHWRKTPDGTTGPILFYAGNVRGRNAIRRAYDTFDRVAPLLCV